MKTIGKNNVSLFVIGKHTQLRNVIKSLADLGIQIQQIVRDFPMWDISLLSQRTPEKKWESRFGLMLDRGAFNAKPNWLDVEGQK